MKGDALTNGDNELCHYCKMPSKTGDDGDKCEGGDEETRGTKECLG